MRKDQALIDAYTSLGVSADRIAAYQETRFLFLARLPEDVRAQDNDDAIIWRLFQLRKSNRLPKAQSYRRP